HDVISQLAAGVRTKVWAYNGQLPGPLIEVNEGDMVEVHLRNQLPQATTIHWHGLPIPPNQDGNPQGKVRTSIPRTKNENFSHLISIGYQ
ncbi:multicopper oxidase domain-containing protein, partial [Aeromonas caviae]|uniref:multicopper oxidase domain-containing protein n=1 Tax=Aeromonas caviae TaxID=648 RepID=UPI0012D74A3D